MSGRPAIFLDRDGLIVENVEGQAARSVDQLVLLGDIAAILRRLAGAGFRLIVVSNQPDFALANISLRTRNEIERRFERLLAAEEITLDAIYYCYHHPDSKMIEFAELCECRKPRPGMIWRGIREHDIDATTSWMIGDRASDVKAGTEVGLRTILFDRQNSQAAYLATHNVRPNFQISELDQIIPIVCRGPV